MKIIEKIYQLVEANGFAAVGIFKDKSLIERELKEMYEQYLLLVGDNPVIEFEAFCSQYAIQEIEIIVG